MTQIQGALKKKLIEYMKAKDAERVGVVRFLLSAISNKEIDFKGQGMEMEDKHVVKVILKQIKQRKDSIESYKSGGRDDLVQKETGELAILEEILQEFAPEDAQ